jgi:hypothetical protein
MGWVLDLLGISMYALLGHDYESGLPFYKCLRGINAVKSFHSELSRGLVMNNWSVEGIYAWSIQMASWHNNENILPFKTSDN